MTTRFSVVSIMCLWLQAPGTSAHHSFATHYDYDREIVITGVVTSARLANPHSFFAVDVTVSDGSIESWEIEGNSIPLLTRAGITRDTFQVGDVVTVTGMLSRDPDRKLMFGLVADAADGETYHLIRPGWDRPAPSITLVRGAGQSLDIGDFAGIWQRVIREGELMNLSGDSPLPLNENGLVARAAYNPLESQYKDCVSVDIPSLFSIPYLKEFRVLGNQVDIYYEYTAVLRQFVADGRPRLAHETDQYGVSRAGMVGDELLIVTDGFRPSSAGLASDFGPFGRGAHIPSSRHKRLTETYRLLNDGEILEVSLVVEDQEYLSEPYETTLIWARRPEGTEIFDFECELDIARKSTSNAVVD